MTPIIHEKNETQESLNNLLIVRQPVIAELEFESRFISHQSLHVIVSLMYTLLKNQISSLTRIV